jgi:methionyl-tRNA synthetase
VPGEEGRKVIYVWFDALINYLAESGWPDAGWEALWPADAHLMAKEIFTRFHATLWPAMLMALGLPLPRHVVGHGWWTVAGEKGSKSKGNIPGVEEVVSFLREKSGAPEEICIDALRYYLIRDIRFTDDSEFSLDMLVTRFNADLANDLGNVLNRVLGAKYYGGRIPEGATPDPGLAEAARQAVAGYEAALERFDWGVALQSAWTLLDAVNKYLDAKAPWKLTKAGDEQGVADAVYNALEGARLAAVLVAPAMPKVAAEIARQLGVADPTPDGGWADVTRWGALVPGTPTAAPAPIFPRIDTKKDKPQTVTTTDAATPTPAETPAAAPAAPVDDTITIDDFMKVKFRVAEIVAAEKVPNADKLLKLDQNLGEEMPARTILSGIAEYYTPEELVGRQIVVVANLAPRKMRGIMSQGMLLAATDAEGRAILLTPEKKAAPGAEVR